MMALEFAGELFQTVKDGELTVAIRPHSDGLNGLFLKDCRFNATFRTKAGRKRKLQLVTTEHTVVKQLHRLTDAEAQDAGWSDRFEARRALREQNPDLGGTDSVAIVRFRLVASGQRRG